MDIKSHIKNLSSLCHTDTVEGLQELFINALKNRGDDSADTAIHKVLREYSVVDLAWELNLTQSTVARCINYARRMTNNTR